MTIFLAMTGAALAPGLVFADLTQTTAQETAKKLNDRAADDSIKNAVTNGMRALTSLNDLDLPGALKNGVKAYGQYRNSEELDRLKDLNQDTRNKMGSDASAAQASTKYKSPFARLPKNFLYEGEAGKLAAEVERISGISREDLLRKVTAMEAGAKKVPDGQWARWVLRATGEFADNIPNERFRSIVLKAHSLAERLVGSGEALSVIAKAREGGDVKGILAPAATKAENAPALASAGTSSSSAVASSDSSPASPAPRLAVVAAPPGTSAPAKGLPTSASGIHQLESSAEFMDQLVNSAVATKAAEPSIFDQVTKKIRELDRRGIF